MTELEAWKPCVTMIPNGHVPIKSHTFVVANSDDAERGRS